MSEEDMTQRQQEEQYMQEQDYCHQLEGANHQLAAENERLRGELAALREAMGPLATEAKRYASFTTNEPDADRLAIIGHRAPVGKLTLAQLRAAVSAFDAAGAGEKG